MSLKLKIGKRDYDVEEKELNQADLSFYPENPRVYSVLNVSNGVPSQEEIEETLSEMEHVKQLCLSIKANGGLIDPLIVRDGDFVVLEGNSRLAAYRILCENDPIQWSTVKCKILPNDISESAIFTLLGQYHIIGRKDWSPYEQAGYLYRRTQSSKTDVEFIAKELGLTPSTARNYVNTYAFMVEKEDLKPDHWSYYDEYLKNQSIKKYRDTNPDLDDTISEQIKSDQIRRAVDIRDKLGVIAKIKSKTAKKIIQEISNGKTNIYDGFDRVEDTGKTDQSYQILNKFRGKITEKDFKSNLAKGSLDQVKFELKKIKQKIDSLLEEFSNIPDN